MGRRDAVQFTLEWAAEARRLGAIVEFEPGWETAGNGQSANYMGGLVHHTAFLSSPSNPFPAKDTLKNGRPGLGGPLCNVAGPWCEDGAPRLVVISANPANHAGASGGKSMGPLPVTSLFNPLVFGLEIDYGGFVAMSKGQRKAATIFGRALINVLERDAEYIRAHAETSVTGKWDIGVGDGMAHTDDMAAFRRGITNFAGGEDDMFDDRDRELLEKAAGLADHVNWNLTPAIARADAAFDRPFVVYVNADDNSPDKGQVVLGGPGVWWTVPPASGDADYLMVLRYMKLASEGQVSVPLGGWMEFAQQMWIMIGATVDIDTAGVEAKLDGLIAGLDSEAFAAIAKAVVDLQAERLAS